MGKEKKKEHENNTNYLLLFIIAMRNICVKKNSCSMLTFYREK